MVVGMLTAKSCMIENYEEICKHANIELCI